MLSTLQLQELDRNLLGRDVERDIGWDIFPCHLLWLENWYILYRTTYSFLYLVISSRWLRNNNALLIIAGLLRRNAHCMLHSPDRKIVFMEVFADQYEMPQWWILIVLFIILPLFHQCCQNVQGQTVGGTPQVLLSRNTQHHQGTVWNRADHHSKGEELPAIQIIQCDLLLQGRAGGAVLKQHGHGWFPGPWRVLNILSSQEKNGFPPSTPPLTTRSVIVATAGPQAW